MPRIPTFVQHIARPPSSAATLRGVVDPVCYALPSSFWGSRFWRFWRRVGCVRYTVVMVSFQFSTGRLSEYTVTVFHPHAESFDFSRQSPSATQTNPNDFSFAVRSFELSACPLVVIPEIFCYLPSCAVRAMCRACNVQHEYNDYYFLFFILFFCSLKFLQGSC